MFGLHLSLTLAVLCWVAEFVSAGFKSRNAKSYQTREIVPLEFKALTSTRTQAPIQYSKLPLCGSIDDSKDDTHRKRHSLGAVLQGYDSIEASPYVLKMKEDMYCQQLCIADLGPPQASSGSNSKIIKAIQKGYHHNWMVDKLDAATKQEDEATVTTRYWLGFPVGFIRAATNTAYIHNHVNIEIMYHPVMEAYRVVRFIVNPFSIKHDFVPIDTAAVTPEDDSTLKPIATIKNPIASCDPNVPIPEKDKSDRYYFGDAKHTTYEMVTGIDREPQPASGQVLFTYDVSWIQQDELEWAARWDVYTSMSNVVPDRVHWYPFFNSMVVLTSILGIILTAYLRRLRKAAKLTPGGEKDDIEEQQEEGKEGEESKPRMCYNIICSRSGRQAWRLLHGDVFRPPKCALALAVFCGTGAHLLCTCICVIFLGSMGIWHPSRQAFMVLDIILVYVTLGWAGGFSTAQKCQELGVDTDRQHLVAAFWTAFGFPGLMFSFFLGVFVWGKQIESTWGVSSSTVLSLLSLWLLVMAPITFLGSWLGRRRRVKGFPVDVADEPRPIPEKSCFMGYFCPIFGFAMNSVWPYGAGFVELHFLLASVWMHFWHQPFLFLATGFAMVVATCSLVNILTTYCQLCRENHQWWWCSFRNGAWTGLFVWLYSAVYFSRLQATDFFTYYLYFGSMTLSSIGLGLLFGYVGLSSSTWFNRAIFGMIVHTH